MIAGYWVRQNARLLHLDSEVAVEFTGHSRSSRPPGLLPVVPSHRPPPYLPRRCNSNACRAFTHSRCEGGLAASTEPAAANPVRPAACIPSDRRAPSAPPSRCTSHSSASHIRRPLIPATLTRSSATAEPTRPLPLRLSRAAPTPARAPLPCLRAQLLPGPCTRLLLALACPHRASRLAPTTPRAHRDHAVHPLFSRGRTHCLHVYRHCVLLT